MQLICSFEVKQKPATHATTESLAVAVVVVVVPVAMDTHHDSIRPTEFKARYRYRASQTIAYFTNNDPSAPKHVTN